MLKLRLLKQSTFILGMTWLSLLNADVIQLPSGYYYNIGAPAGQRKEAIDFGLPVPFKYNFFVANRLFGKTLYQIRKNFGNGIEALTSATTQSPIYEPVEPYSYEFLATDNHKDPKKTYNSDVAGTVKHTVRVICTNFATKLIGTGSATFQIVEKAEYSFPNVQSKMGNEDNFPIGINGKHVTLNKNNTSFTEQKLLLTFTVPTDLLTSDFEQLVIDLIQIQPRLAQSGYYVAVTHYKK